MKPLLLGLVLYLAFWCPGALCGIDPSQDADADGDFAWFSTLGFPDVRGCSVARVATGSFVQVPPRPPEKQFLPCFLLHYEDDGQFTVLTPDLFTINLKTSAAGTPELRRVGYEKTPLSEAAAAYFDALTSRTPESLDSFVSRFGKGNFQATEVFVWAWACWRNGIADLPARLYAEAIRNSGSATDGETRPKNFREQLQQQLGYSMIWRATLDFENPSIPRPRLLESFERIARDYPASQYASRARETADLLRTMVAEDADHAAKPAVPLKDLPPDQRVSELIFRLRDQNGSQPGQPGRCDIFRPPHGVGKDMETSPAAQLVDLGNAAVPQLIAALDDRRYSRSVGYFRDFLFSHYVLTVGDCARQILARIAGEGLSEEWNHDSSLGQGNPNAAFKARVEAWWRQMEHKGEKQVLIDAVSQGGSVALGQAFVLQKRYPEATLDAVTQGVKNSRGNATRAELVALAGSLPGDGALAFLKDELRHGLYLGERVSAAWALWGRGRDEEAESAMIHDWEALPAGRERVDLPDIEYTYAPEELIGFLADCGKVEAIQALQRDLRRRPADFRMGVVSALQPHRPNGTMFSMNRDRVAQAGFERPFPRQDDDEDAKVSAAIEALLATELEDTEEVPKTSVIRQRKNCTVSRVCDLAGETLAERRQGKYVFDLSGAPADREQQRINCLKVWREEHAQTPPPSSP